MMLHGGVQWCATLTMAAQVLLEWLPIHRIVEMSNGIEVTEAKWHIHSWHRLHIGWQVTSN